MPQVFGDKDADGFYRGEGGGRTGYIPCNMVTEVAVDSAMGKQQLLRQGYLSPEALAEASGRTRFPSHQPRPTPGITYVWAASFVQAPAGPSQAPAQKSMMPCDLCLESCRGGGLALVGAGSCQPLKTKVGNPDMTLSIHYNSCPRLHLPCLSLSFLSPCLHPSGNGPFVYSTAHTAGPPPKPRRAKKGGKDHVLPGARGRGGTAPLWEGT